jgi:hypothetical protein
LAYGVNSSMRLRWFKDEHDARREMVEVYLEGLHDEYVDYEEAEAAFQSRRRHHHHHHGRHLGH